MFTITFERAEIFKSIIEAIADVCTNINLEITREGITASALDPSQVALVQITIDKSLATEYEVGSGNTTVGINTANLFKILKCFKTQCPLTLSSDGDDNGDETSDTLCLRGGDPAHEQLEFGMKLIAIESERMEIPDADFDCAFEIAAADVNTVFREFANLGSDTVVVTCGDTGGVSRARGGGGRGGDGEGGSSDDVPKYISFSCSNDIVNNARVRIKPTRIEFNRPVNSTYALKYLSLFMKAARVNPVVRFVLTNENPVQLVFSTGGTSAAGSTCAGSAAGEKRSAVNTDENSKLSKVRYFLAPKSGEE